MKTIKNVGVIDVGDFLIIEEPFGSQWNGRREVLALIPCAYRGRQECTSTCPTNGEWAVLALRDGESWIDDHYGPGGVTFCTARFGQPTHRVERKQ